MNVLQKLFMFVILLISFVNAQDRQAGTERTDSHGVLQVWVPAGTFQMGSDELPTEPIWAVKSYQTEMPRFSVIISQGYWLDKTEVTYGSFQQFYQAGGYTTEDYWSADGWTWISSRWLGMYPIPCHDSSPLMPQGCITWYEAEAYAKWRGGRLPTEAEWEYAATGTKGYRYPWGNEWDDRFANLSDHAVEVGQYTEGASWVGALDMSGNLMEWVSDWLDFEFDRTQVTTDPQGAPNGFVKMEKGGWYNSNPSVARNAYHHFEDPPHYSDSHIGMRVLTQDQN